MENNIQTHQKKSDYSVMYCYIVDLQWLEHLCNYVNKFETVLVRVNEYNSKHII